jgi:hypothetical protein
VGVTIDADARSLVTPRRSTGALLAAATLGIAACTADDEPIDPPPVAEPDPDADGGEPDDTPDGGPPGDGDDEALDDGAGDGAPDDDGLDDRDADDDGTAAAEGDGQDVPPLDVEPSTGESEAVQSSGARLTLTDVRVGTHDGFDRVTLEVEGDGTVGWFARADDEGRTHGKGEEVDVEGDHVLTVALRGMELPPERPEDVTPFAAEADRSDGALGPRVQAPTGAVALTEVVVGGVFEGQKQVFLGTAEEVPFRITRFEEPERLVIDLVHP